MKHSLLVALLHIFCTNTVGLLVMKKQPLKKKRNHLQVHINIVLLRTKESDFLKGVQRRQGLKSGFVRDIKKK
jgi:hypothetical protein